MNVLDNFYAALPEPTQSCLLALRELILVQPDGLPYEAGLWPGNKNFQL